MSSFSNAIEAGRAFLKVVVDDADVAKGFERIQTRLNTLGQKMQKWGAISAGVSAVVAAPFIASIKAASDAQETMSKFDVVFAKQSKQMKAWGDALAKGVGRSKIEVAGMLASFQDLLVPMGMNATAASKMSQQLSELAIDLGSFNNMADADVARDLAAALTGSGEVMKKYGVIVSEAAVKQELLNMSLDPIAATEAQKAQARLNIIMAGTTAAQGDALRTAGGFANQMKALQANVRDTAIEIGNVFLPAATSFVTKVNDASKGALAFVAAHPAVVEAIGAIGVAAVGATTLVAALGTALTIATAHPIILGITGIGLAIAGIYIYFDEITAKTNEWRFALEAIAPPGGLLDLLLKLTMIRQLQIDIAKDAKTSPMFVGDDGKMVGGKNGRFHNGQSIGGDEGFFSNGRGLDDAIPGAGLLGNIDLGALSSGAAPANPTGNFLLGDLMRKAGLPGGSGGDKLKKRMEGWAAAAANAANAFNPLAGVDVGGMTGKATRFGKKALAGNVDWEGMGEDAQEHLGGAWKRINEFFSGKSELASVGTFNANAVASLQGGNLDQQMLSVLQKQLGIQERMERKGDGWGAT